MGPGLHTWDGMGTGMEDTVPAVMAWSGRREVGLHAGNTDYSIFDKQSKTGPSNIWIKLLRRISVQSWSKICTISDIFTKKLLPALP